MYANNKDLFGLSIVEVFQLNHTNCDFLGTHGENSLTAREKFHTKKKYYECCKLLLHGIV